MCFTSKRTKLIDSLDWISEPKDSKSGQGPSIDKSYFLCGNGKTEKYEIYFREEDAQKILRTIGAQFDFQFAYYGQSEGAIRLIEGDAHSINVYNKRNKNGTIKPQYRISCVPFGRFFEKQVGKFRHYYFDVVTMDGSVVLLPTGERDRNGSK